MSESSTRVTSEIVVAYINSSSATAPTGNSKDAATKIAEAFTIIHQAVLKAEHETD